MAADGEKERAEAWSALLISFVELYRLQDRDLLCEMARAIQIQVEKIYA